MTTPDLEHFSWSPPAHHPLSSYVERVWASAGGLELPRERIIPSGTADLVLNLGAPIMLIEPTGAMSAVPFACASGLLKQAAVLEHPHLHRALGVRLTPAGAAHLFDGAIRELVDGFEPFELVSPARYARHERALGLKPDVEPLHVLVHRMARWLEGELADAQPDLRIERARSMIMSSQGQVRMAHVAASVGLSSRVMIARFVSSVGITPKLYARHVRLRHALRLLQAPQVELAQLALEAGFYDQAHMSAELRALIDLSPAQCVGRLYGGEATLSEG